ncbi:ANTAR domain-containing protein [Streptomyces sp. NPDC005648]|uniref:ANTAR domain-containing protein n=1 Tax=Streptomyces sp. NPDC005648 TaxID=3157044 RepID=UPI00339EFC3C
MSDVGVPCLATIRSAADGDRVVVAVRGELDIGAGHLRSALNDALDRSATGVDLDLAGVGFCDCGGLNVLLELRKRALAESKTVAVLDCSPGVGRLLDLTGTHELFVSPDPGDPDSGPADVLEGGVLDGRAPRGNVDRELRTEVDQLRRAMRTRPAIDVARGILMASFGLSPEDAWTVLVSASQNTNTKLHHLARELVGTVDGGPLPEAVRQQLAAAVARVQESGKGIPPCA